MRLELPLSRGRVDPLVPLRELLDPSTLVRKGPEAATSVAPAITQVQTFIVGPRGEIALVSEQDGYPQRPPHLYRPRHAEALKLLDEGCDSYFIGATDNHIARVAIVVDPRAHGQGTGDDNSTANEQDNDQKAPTFAWAWANLRWAGYLLEPDESALAVSAVSLAAWHRMYQFCAQCGSPVGVVNGGWASRCSGCAKLEFPRHDPAVIVLVIDGHDRALLAHNVNWEGNFASTIAGFVEAGESPDLAVARELMEEVGVRICEPEYVGTQPWPFPRSQMLGYVARTVDDTVEPVPDGEEIEWAAFYSREELAHAIEQEQLVPPGRSSIAYAMLREWYGGELPQPPNASDPLRLPW
ncbi:NAD(+) diphosphatase [Schaalia vaccimaxillae]|uniref:NAD(+) diphosphatase n=1 Tax=Schaalia vaccimaxillae TaxID=183916 RepID=UPI0003B40ED1|nr:NAD(+) diphosphatase [Schaalia vaccimaxillae]